MPSTGRGPAVRDGPAPPVWAPQWASDGGSSGPTGRAGDPSAALLDMSGLLSEGGAPLDHAEAVSRLMAQRSSAGDDSAKWFTALFSALQVILT